MVGHTRGYTQVLVPRDPELLGRSAFVKVDSANK